MRSMYSLLLAASLLLPGTSGAQTDDALFEQVVQKARELAAEPHRPADPEALPEKLRELSYSQYRDIRFNKDEALWSEQTPFSVELFHLGFLYREPVLLNEVVDGETRLVAYDPDLFDYGNNKRLGRGLQRDLGFAGFRIHYPINDPAYKDELIVFLGASYFRMVGRGQNYGLSARGLAIDTGSPDGEEFPRFTEFWLVRPAPDATSVTLYALLESESVTGAYRFELRPGADTALDVDLRLFARNDVDKLGLAPLTSMFMWGENRVRHYDDFRPEVHDSDGLLVQTSAGEWIWRPLFNPLGLHVSSLIDARAQAFGLAQRDRDFTNYHDMESRYENRPGFWVTPRGGDWGKGAVQLIEIPSEEETNDNVVAFWTPEQPLGAGQERSYGYTLRTFSRNPVAPEVATVQRTRIGWGAVPGDQIQPSPEVRQFIVDFAGGELDGLHAAQPLKPNLSISTGQHEDLMVQRLPGDEGWRVAFKLDPGEQQKPVDMRLFLTLNGRRVSETWNYVWTPDLL